MAVITIKCTGTDGCWADVYVARYEVYPNVDPTGVLRRISATKYANQTKSPDTGTLLSQTQIYLAGSLGY